MDMQKLAQLLAEAEAGDLLACADLATQAPALGREVIALRAELNAGFETRNEKIARQKAQITGLAETVRKAKHTIKELKRKVRNQTAGETRDIDQLIRCQIRIENQRQEIDRLRRKEAASSAEDTELARLRNLISGLDPDHWGLQARVVALKAEALREGGA